jgi:NDP-sugar pyrophosphorylase family protein
VSTPPHALVLAAGLGTRLRPLTDVRAKPAIPVAGEPLVRRIVAWLARGGVTDTSVNLHYLPQTLTSVLGDGSDLGARVRYSLEQPVVLGSAGGPRQAADIVGADTFWLVNGDTLTDVDLDAMADAHGKTGALVTLALVPNTEYLRYGGVRVHADGRVLGFVARGPAAEGSFHLIGVQLVSREAFADVARGVPVNSTGGLYERLIADRPGSIRAFVSNARFWDIGTVADYWKTSQQLGGGDRSSHAAQSTSTARVSRSILWDRVEIGDGAELDECIVTDDVVVPPGARYRRMILMREPGGRMTAAPLVMD